MVYHTTKCPYCKFTLDFMNTHPHKIGPELLPCPNCGKLYRTGIKLWKDMDQFEKDEYSIHKYLLCLISSSLVSAPISSIIFGDSINWIKYSIVCAVFLVWGIFITNNEIKNETSITFEKFLLDYWKKYDNNCDNLFEETNKSFLDKYSKDFFTVEKEILPANIYDINKYYKINDRINYLLKYMNSLKS